MGLFDRFTGKKAAPTGAGVRPGAPESTSLPDSSAAEAATPTPAPATAAAVKPRLIAAREKLEGKDLPGAMAIYEEVLGAAGDRADVLVTISGDLGTHGHVAEIIELIAPRYDAERHGPATGLNLLQAYLAVRNVDAGQHVLDILFALHRPELEERLHGFSNALAEMMAAPQPQVPSAADEAAPGAPAVPKVGLITISKPIWYYGLEVMGPKLLPQKQGKPRRVAFAQLALPGYKDIEAAINQPEDELGRLSRALPLWLAETFQFAVNYSAVAALGIISPPSGPTRHMIFGTEWSTDNLRQLVDTTEGGLDYIFTGALRVAASDYELVLRLYEVKSFRERKKLVLRWTPATVDAELTQLQGELRRFMEWTPASSGLTYTAPTSPRAWLETLGASSGLFVAEKGIVPTDILPPVMADLNRAAEQAAGSEAASLAYLTLQARASKLGTEGPKDVRLAFSPLVDEARQVLGG